MVLDNRTGIFDLTWNIKYDHLYLTFIIKLDLPIAQSTNTPNAKNGCSPNATGMNAAE